MFGITPYGRRGIDRKRDFRDFDTMFDSMMRDFYETTMSPFQSMGKGQIRVDIREDEKDYILEAELPGVDKGDIKLELKDDLLTLSVEKEEENKEEKENYIRQERRYGTFRRSFYIDDINTDKIKAKFENGVLYVTLPKKEHRKVNGNTIPIE